MRKIVSFNSFMILFFFVIAIVSSFACINTNAENKAFKITNVTLEEKSDDVTGDISGFDGEDIKNNITFHKVNGYVIYKITIKNTNTKDINIKSITDNNSNEYITYEYNKHENYNVKSGNTFDLYVKATYKKELTDINKRIQNTKVKFNINYLGEDNNVINDVISINPKTGDYIPSSFVMLLISLIGLITCIVIKAKEKRKKISKAGILVLTLMLTIPVVVKAASIKVGITLESSYSLYDKMVITTIVDGKEKQIVVPYNDETPELEEPTPKAGYEFEKWTLSDGSDYVPTEHMTKDVVVVAKFKTINYSITYNLDGGSADNPTTYTVEDKITLNNPTKQGFDFIGWTGSGVTTPQKNLVINKGTTGPLTYTANFTPSTNTPYKVKHRYLKLTDGYDEVKENKTGTTNDYVTPELKPKAGFISPSTQNVQIKPDGSTEVIYTYERQPYTFTITDRTYIDSSSTANGTYPYETAITIKAVEREGYTFKWSDNVESYERTFNISQNTTLTPVYTPRTDTPYKVIHKKQKLTLDGYDIEETENKTGTTGEPVTPAVKSYTGFTSPTTQTTTIKGDGTTEIVYEYNREKYDFSFNDNEFVTSTKPAGKYPYGTEITLTAQTREGYTFTKWNNNETNNPYTFELSGDLTIEPVYAPRTDTAYKVIHQKQKVTLDGYETVETENKTGTTGEPVTPAVKEYTGFETPATQTKTIKPDGSMEIEYKYDRKVYKVTFDTDGGSSIDDQTIVYEGKVVKPSDPTKDNYDFKGWYKDSGYSTEFDFNTEIITSATTIYAKWEEKEDQPYICRRAEELHTSICNRDSQGCITTGFKKGERIIFGNTTEEENIKAGNAFDCDVNGDGEFDSDTERFYYLRTVGNKAALISHTNFEGENGQAIVNNFLHDNAYAQLPTTTQWSNTTKFGEKAARFPSQEDLRTACGVEDLTTDGSLKDCYFISENTTYVSEAVGRSGTWLNDEDDKYYRYQNVAIKVMNVDGTSKNAVRPVIEIPLAKIDLNNEIPKETITFDTQGGSSIDPIEKQHGTKIGTLPIPEKDNYVFMGWYKDSEYTTPVNSDELIIEDMTVYAEWEEASDAVALVNGEFCNSITEAVDKAPKNTKTTVKLLKNTAEYVQIPSNKNIEFDLQNFTISNSEVKKNILKIYGTATIKNGTIASNAESGAIDVENTGKLYISGGQVLATGKRQALYNNGGIVEISGNTYLSNTTNERAAVQNLNAGVMKITGGTIKAASYSGVKNDDGTLVIGDKDGVIDKTTPIIQGSTYGIETIPMFSFYDGTLKGVTNAINNESKIFDIEAGSEIIHDTEVIESVTYKTAYLNIDPTKNKITFDPNGGEVDEDNRYVEAGSEIGDLPTPTKGVYTFDGWYTEADGGEKISTTTIPTGKTTYYAHWSFEASDEIVEFNPTNDVMKVYYNNIATWKDDESTFQTKMTKNFNDYNCKCNENTCNTAGTELCDKPEAYDTGVDDELEVYLSNEDKEKGDEVEYTRSTDGTITNLIPGKVYYWEAKNDSNIHGYVKAIADRRIIDVNGVRNVRDLGGMNVTNSSGTGTLKYGKIFRGEKLWNDSENVTRLKKLGINEEVDLRRANERDSAETAFPAEEFKQLESKHYQLDFETQRSNYNLTRKTVKTIMEDIVDGKKIYYHCRIGTDRTGTISYILEGLLGVEEEQRLQDYELSFFFGLVNRHRFYSYDSSSSVSTDQKFVYMRNIMSTNQEIYDWYMLGSTNQQEDNDLIDAFRTKMINYN